MGTGQLRLPNLAARQDALEDAFGCPHAVVQHLQPPGPSRASPYAYTSGAAVKALMSAMPPAMVLVDTRPSSMAPPNSNIAAICRVRGAFREVQSCSGGQWQQAASC